jgi:hypothetical protein
MKSNSILKGIFPCLALAFVLMGCNQDSLPDTNVNVVTKNDVVTSSPVQDLTPSPSVPKQSSSSTQSEMHVYTKEQLENDPRAPSKDPADYNSNGEYVPKNGVSKNPGDYNANGDYKPVDQMTQEEKRKELEDMLGKSLK